MAAGSQSSKTFLERALLLISRGIPVIPVQPKLKRCTLDGWQNAATTELKQIEKWNAQNPEFNTGAVAQNPGKCIFDPDVPGLVERIKEEAGVDLVSLRTFKVRAGKPSPLGHYYFDHTARSLQLGNKQRKVRDLALKKETVEFDFKAINSYCVGPGSVHPNGSIYTVVDESPVVPIPDALCDWIEKNSGVVDIGKAPAAAGSDLIEALAKRPGTLAQRAIAMISGRTGIYEKDKELIRSVANFDHRHQADEAIAVYLFSVYGDQPEAVARHLSQVRFHTDRTESYVETTVKSAYAYAQKYRLIKKAKESKPLVVSVGSEFLKREIPPREVLVKLQNGTDLVYAQSSNQVFAFRGTGKTLFSMGAAAAFARGEPFLNWVPQRPLKVLYVEGEMPIGQVQQRLRWLKAGVDNFRLITLDEQDGNYIPKISTPEGRQLIEDSITDEDALFLDSISTLANIATNDEENWLEYTEWMMTLRSRGLSLWPIQHAGKAGLQRGHSKSEDHLDLSIKLERPDDYEPSQMFRVNLIFDKIRSNSLVEMVEVSFNEQDGFTFKHPEGQWEEKGFALLKQKKYSKRELAKELGCGETTALRIIRKFNGAEDKQPQQQVIEEVKSTNF